MGSRMDGRSTPAPTLLAAALPLVSYSALLASCPHGYIMQLYVAAGWLAIAAFERRCSSSTYTVVHVTHTPMLLLQQGVK
jgi:hypothetical protein